MSVAPQFTLPSPQKSHFLMGFLSFCPESQSYKVLGDTDEGLPRCSLLPLISLLALTPQAGGLEEGGSTTLK